MRNTRHTATALLSLVITSSAMASATFQQPFASLEKNRLVDQIMPPLATRPALTDVLATSAVTDSTTLARTAAMGYTKVPAEFNRYLSTLAGASFSSRQAGAKVHDELAFNEMKRYLFNRYNGLTVLRTVQQEGKLFDCILRAQQPGMRDGAALASPPALPGAPAAAAKAAADQRCDDGTVPLERLDLAAMVAYPDLTTFLHRQKAPRSAALRTPSRSTPKPPATSSNGHYYSSAFIDTAGIPITGGGALLNVWDPAMPAANDVQSISQIWLAGSSTRGTETVEVGWEEQPPAGWGSKPIIFVYSTQDGYNQTGCHNLDCADFVQTSARNLLGAVPPAGFSVAGGKQTTLAVEFQRNTDGNWWVRIDNEWIGYYKANLYAGDLSKPSATTYFSAGGEISTQNHLPSTVMGSGQFASAGYKKAAFQANHFYRDAGLNTYAVQRLNVGIDNPTCYTMAISGYQYTAGPGLSNATASPEMTSGGFFFGGPGCR